MRAVRKDRPDGGLVLAEVPVPTPGDGELLVQVHLAGICGTDLSIRAWRPYVRGLVVLPRVLGHEFVGTVVDAGPGTTISVGTRLTADSDGGCGLCWSCRRGKRNFCTDQRRIGTQRDGGLAEFVLVPERSAYPLPDDVSDRVGCLLEPMAAAVHAVERLPSPAGGSAAVIGPGPIGVLAGVALASVGVDPVHVIGLPDDASRLALAESLGLTPLLFDDAAARLSGTAPWDGVDVVVDAVGSAESLTLATAIARPGGAISIVGLGAAGHVDVSSIVAKELSVLGSWRRLPGTWDRTIAIAARRPDLADLVEGTYPLVEHDAAFDALEGRAHMKIVLEIAR